MIHHRSGLPMLVVGGDSMIGRACTARLLERGDAVCVTTRSSQELSPHRITLDLSTETLPTLPVCAAAVICAAITRQEQCRHNPSETRRVNVVQTLRLIHQLIEANSFVVFLSTNLVFDGRRRLQRAADPLSPITEYGRQKAEAEQALSPWADQVAIVRLTKVFQPGLPLIQKWRDDLGAGRAVNAFSDYVCSPVTLETVVEGIVQIMAEHRSGIWQFSGPADVTYADLAREVAGLCGAESSLVKATTAPPGLLEHLPLHTTLDSTRARDELGLRFPKARNILATCLGQAGQSRLKDV